MWSHRLPGLPVQSGGAPGRAGHLPRSGLFEELPPIAKGVYSGTKSFPYCLLRPRAAQAQGESQSLLLAMQGLEMQGMLEGMLGEAQETGGLQGLQSMGIITP